jgi:hypothetical protein
LSRGTQAGAHGQLHYNGKSRFGQRNGAEGLQGYLEFKTHRHARLKTTEDIPQINDRVKIAALLNGYAHAVDAKDWGVARAAAELDR